MVKTQPSAVVRCHGAARLLVALCLAVASGCYGVSAAQPRSTWGEPGQAAGSVTADRAPPAAGPSAAARATVRGQGNLAFDPAAPGSDAYTRAPMPVSGMAAAAAPAPTTTTARPPAAGAAPPTGTPVLPPSAAVAPVLPPAGPPAQAPVTDTSQWLTSPYLQGGPAGDMPPMEQLPGTPVPIDILVEEARTGRFMFGAGINSDAGVTGQITVDERNFDLFGFPRRASDIWSGRAFRGAGQAFRLEAMPGTQVQRYLVSFTEPYLLSTPISLNVSGFLYDRGFYDWAENRLGGRLGLGYRLTPDLSVNAALRMEDVDITRPRILGVPQLDDVLGSNDLYTARFTLRHDTRDMPFLPTEGHLIELSYEQAFGQFDFPRADVDYRRYFLVRERPDGSGRHVLAASLGAGFTGPDTPVFENYFAGGFSTLRGFHFRGASPVVSSVTVGGRFRLLGSFEYMLPLTADDMIRAVAFVDYGTVEQEIELHESNFRVAPGFGFRITVPALGPAPLAFDFAFPVAKADTDDTQMFSFFFGFNR